MFFMAEYANMITVSCLATILFFGGWQSPFPDYLDVAELASRRRRAAARGYCAFDTVVYMRGIARIQFAVVTLLASVGGVVCLIPAVQPYVMGPFWFITKLLVFMFFYVIVRGTLPRFRYDQLMSFGWKFLLPVSLANLVITAFMFNLLRRG